MSNELVVKNAEGQDQTISVVDIVVDNNSGKQYLFYNVPESDGLYATILVESDTSYVLEAISSDEEWNLVEDILKSQLMTEGANGE